MTQCTNYSCGVEIMRKNKLRCGLCRKAKLYTCSDCDTEMSSPRAILCGPCRQNHKNEFMHGYRNKDLECLMCGEILPLNHWKACPGDCHKHYNRMYNCMVGRNRNR